MFATTIIHIITGLALLGFCVAAVTYIAFKPFDCAESDPEKDAGVEPKLIDAICPDCSACRINRLWTTERYRIAAGPTFPSIQCPACFVKSCQAKNADRRAPGRWSQPGRDAVTRVPNSIS